MEEEGTIGGGLEGDEGLDDELGGAGDLGTGIGDGDELVGDDELGGGLDDDAA